MAVIFNIQKFSLHDGAGIRTVVFFKGCPLKCRWCANPESQRSELQYFRDMAKCIHCGLCNKNIFEPQKCPASALTAQGKEYTTDEVLSEVLKDKAFYKSSGGGVTFSGGEPLLQWQFIKELSDKLHERNINTCAETTGYINEDIFAQAIKCLDFLLFDLKHYDREKHKQGTGVYNDLILKNLRTAVAQNKDITARIPIIPNFNDSLDDAKAFSALLNDIGVKNVNLLPFHQMGEKKYELLGTDYSMKNIKPLHKEDLEKHREIFQSYGLNCTL